METTVKERLTKFLRYKNINMSEFARLINVSTSYVNSIRKSIQPDKIKSIASNFPELNTEWLLTGTGEMVRETETTQPETKDEIVIRLLNEMAEQREIIKRLIAIIEGDSEQPKKSRV